MFTIEEVRTALRNKKLHWATKCLILYSYQNKLTEPYDFISMANLFNVSPDYVFDSIRLATYVLQYPKIAKLFSRKEALALLHKYQVNPKELRRQINLAGARYKLNRKKLKDAGLSNNRHTNSIQDSDDNKSDECS